MYCGGRAQADRAQADRECSHISSLHVSSRPPGHTPCRPGGQPTIAVLGLLGKNADLGVAIVDAASKK